MTTPRDTNIPELQAKLKHYRLNAFEYQRICELLGRAPQGVEWALFSALWSEHCSYKSSKVHLSKFAKTLNASVLAAQGENAGVLDLGFDERIVFKMESHNHPSFIEPFQGAATGVGGILRDIFTMGARPIACANFLCFGEEKAPRMPALIQGVVSGISYYGNCVGVPNVTGRTHFHKEYNRNILVNAFALGLLSPGQRVTSNRIRGVGNWVVYVGAKTGRDGIHGASMASQSFADEASKEISNLNVPSPLKSTVQSKVKSTVQIGDAFYEKLLMEACLEVIQKNLVVAIQDMGAAGLTSSSFEMASRGNMGLDLYLDLVPLRDSTLTPEDILLSESQERMLLVIAPEQMAAITEVFARYGLDAVRIGETHPERQVRLFWKSELLTEIDPFFLTENAPRYERPYHTWNFPKRIQKLPLIERFNYDLKSFYRGADQGSKKYIFEQYDKRVGTRTVRASPDSFGVLKLDSGRYLAIALGCRPEWMKRDAFVGAADAVFQPALLMAAQGFNPKAITDCLNFGNPENEQIMSEFVASVDAIRDVSGELDAPVLSGNVSFYNETEGQSIISTPAVGVVGIKHYIGELKPEVIQSSSSRIFRISVAWARSRLETDQFMGGEDLKQVVGFLKSLIQLCDQPVWKEVLSLRLIGSSGLLRSLFKSLLMRKNSRQEKGVLSPACVPTCSVILKADLSLEDLVDDILYQLVFEVGSSAGALFQRTCSALGLSCEEIGETRWEPDEDETALVWRQYKWKVSEAFYAYQEGGIFAELK